MRKKNREIEARARRLVEQTGTKVYTPWLGKQLKLGGFWITVEVSGVLRIQADHPTAYVFDRHGPRLWGQPGHSEMHEELLRLLRQATLLDDLADV